MERTVRKGGSFVTLVSDGRAPVLLFSVPISNEIRRKAFSKGKVNLVYPNGLEVNFSQDRERGEWSNLRWSKDTNRSAELIAKQFELYLDLPLGRRKGRVGWVANNKLKGVFPELISALSPNSCLEIGQSDGDKSDLCLLFAGKKGQCRLRFRAETSHRLQREKVRGATVSFADKTGRLLAVLNPERGCFLDCTQCSRLDCLPFSYEKRGRWIRASLPAGELMRQLGVSLCSLREAPTETRTGEVHWSKRKPGIAVCFPGLQKSKAG